MMEAVTKNKIWLLPAGLVIGLAGIAWMISPILQYNSGYPWDNMLFVLYFIPVIGGAMIARESPRLGGILLIIYGLLGPVNGYIIYFTHPFAGGLYFLLQPIFQDALAFIIPGFLFLLSPPKRSASDIEKTVISKSYFTGLVITTAAAASGIISQILRFYNYPYSAAGIIMDVISGSSILVLVSITIWKRLFHGAVIGAGYSLFMVVYFLMLQAANRTVMLSQMKYDIVPAVLMLIGSTVIIVSAIPKLKIVRLISA